MINCNVGELVGKLEANYKRQIRGFPTERDIEKCEEFKERHNMSGSEIFFHPEEWYYGLVLDELDERDVVFDVGAGNLVFDLIMLEKVKKVYAVEVNPTILSDALNIIGYDMPRELVVICANAFDLSIPNDVTKIVSLFIHNQREFPEDWWMYSIIDAREFLKKEKKEKL